MNSGKATLSVLSITFNELDRIDHVKSSVFFGDEIVIVDEARVEKEAVLGAIVVLSASTKIIDVTGKNIREIKGHVPNLSLGIPESYKKSLPADDCYFPFALINGQLKECTDKKTTLNNTFRENNKVF